MKNMISGLLFLLLSFSPASHQAGQCSCGPVPAEESTRWGNDNITLSTVSRVRVLRGVIIVGSDDLMANALVEVFTDPDVIKLAYSSEVEARRAKQRRVAACFTDSHGRFCLTQLPLGRYELRCSAKNFQAVSQTIKVVGSGRVKKRIIVRLPVAT